MGQYNHQLHTGQKHGLLGMQKCLPSTFKPALQPYMGSNLNTDKPLCRPAPPISLVCQTKCNVLLPHKIISAAYMESPRMGPNLPYKPATPNRKTSHPRTSQSRKTSTQSRKTNTQSRKTNTQSRKTSMPRTTRSSLFPLIIIHVRRYGESSRGPYHP